MVIKEEVLSYKILYKPDLEVICDKAKEIFEIYELEEKIKLKKVNINELTFLSFWKSLTLFISYSNTFPTRPLNIF